MKKCSTKPWKIMKICAAQAVMATIICGVSLAHDNYAQVLDKKVTVDIKNVSLEQALYEIQDASGVKIYFSLETLEMDENDAVSIRSNNEPLRNILNNLLHPRGINYRVDEKHTGIIILKKATKQSDADQSSNTSSFLLSRSVQLDKLITVTGTVTDATTQQPLAGVNIVVKGTTNGTTTDANGKYIINLEDDAVLVFSFIGYTSLEIQISNRNTIDVALEEDIQSLDEVVVNAGYWTVREEESTGNIAKLDASQISKQPVQNTLSTLQGRIPGLEIIQQTGVPGGNFRVRIRGQNSISGGNDPLYVIDGVPFTSSTLAMNETTGEILASGTNPLNTLSTSDIESIEVLKDADATAIYGSRGANGVILITTKKGSIGKTKVDFNFYQGFSKVGRKIELLSTKQYLTMRREAFNNDAIVLSSANAPDLEVWDTTRYTDWQKTLIGETAFTTDAQMNLSGGNKHTQFLFGSGFRKETTVFPGDFSDKRITTHLNLNNTSANGKLKANISVVYSVVLSDLLKQDLTNQAVTLPPNAPSLYDIDGNLNWENSTWENPLSYLRRNYEANTNTLLGNATLSYEVIPDLQVKANMGYTNMLMNAITITPKSSYNPAFLYASAFSAFSNSSFGNWITEPQLNWTKKIGAGILNTLLGSTFLSQTSSALSQTGYGFLSESLMKNLQAASSSYITTNRYSHYRYTAVFARLNYVLTDKYILNLTGRRDGSSRFGPGKQFANFGAMGLAWIFSKETFLRNVSFLSFGKLRMSYGVTGNDQIGDYSFLDTYSVAGPYAGVPGLAPTRLFNSQFGWESNRKFEVALHMGIIGDRVHLISSYYNNRSSDLLVGLALPPTTGFTTIQGNLPAVVENKGWEFELTSRNFERTQFEWRTSLNLSIPKNRLIEFPNLDQSAYSNVYVIGEPLRIAKLYNYLSINPATGLYEYEDMNGDGVVSSFDRNVTRYIGPVVYGGITNTFRHKGFEIDVTFQFVKQSGYNYLYSGWYTAPGGQSNQPDFVMNRWSSEHPSALIQAFSTASAAQTAYSRLAGSDYVVEDASFIRLKNLSIGYSFPERLIRLIGLPSAKVFIQGQNLFTFTKYRGLDPESQTNVLPPLRTIAAGFHFSF